MTKEEFAALIDGRQYRSELTSAEEAQARADGLLVIFGASDDLLEFRGAFDDEVGAYEGTTVRFTREGALQAWEDMDKDDEAEVERYFIRKQWAQTVTAHWDRDGFSWVIESAIPHATFVIKEDDDNYCRGIVISIADLSHIA